MAPSSTNGGVSNEPPRQDSRGTAPPLVRTQPPELPTGGGAIRGIGEKFSANAATGTGSLTIPIATASARGLGPELALHYDSGAGNGPVRRRLAPLGAEHFAQDR